MNFLLIGPNVGDLAVSYFRPCLYVIAPSEGFIATYSCYYQDSSIYVNIRLTDLARGRYRANRHNVTHHIQTTGPPVASKSRRLPPDKFQAAKKEFETMMELGISRPSKSSWASQLHCVPKKNGQWRFVRDYSSLNRITVQDRFPVPQTHYPESTPSQLLQQWIFNYY